MELSTIRIKAQHMFDSLQPYCKAIYLGGSFTQKYLNNPHDIDFICFADDNYQRTLMKGRIAIYNSIHKDEKLSNEDWIQTRLTTKEEHSYGSYIHKDMVLLCGEPINFTFDPIGKDYNEYVDILKANIIKVKNPKRYYQFYRGYLLVSKKTYDLTNEEIINLNKLHDQKDEDKEQLKKLQRELKHNIMRLKHINNGQGVE